MKTTGVSCETKFGLLGFLGHPNVNSSIRVQNYDEDDNKHIDKKCIDLHVHPRRMQDRNGQNVPLSLIHI